MAAKSEGMNAACEQPISETRSSTHSLPRPPLCMLSVLTDISQCSLVMRGMLTQRSCSEGTALRLRYTVHAPSGL